ncbi:MAG TPA: Mut7-C RNAse domain-containing protein [Pontiella sp.]|nr:Mut7-C RNAse domain-containing protein [Pontiella sp.]
MKAHAAEFRFYEELNDFRPLHRSKRACIYRFDGRPAIKDAIEAQGVPHTEVDLIVVNGASVGFYYPLQDGDRAAVYPVFESLDIAPVIRLRDAPLRRASFILDVHLGKLARILRFLGFDTLYRTDYDDSEIIRVALREHRIILTRDRRLLHDRRITHARWLHSVRAEEQACEVIRRFQLENNIRRFARCPACNGLVDPVKKETIQSRLEPLTEKYYTEFYQCRDCGKIYWKGTHYDRIVKKLDAIEEACGSGSSACQGRQDESAFGSEEPDNGCGIEHHRDPENKTERGFL